LSLALKPPGILDPMLPNYKNFHPDLRRGPDIPSVPGRIAVLLEFPVVAVRLWQGCGRTAVVMPKAPMDKDYLLASSEHEIRAARQILRVEPISIPHTMDEMANEQLGLRILRTYAPHDLASLR
jgi:hypothetical protein